MIRPGGQSRSLWLLRLACFSYPTYSAGQTGAARGIETTVRDLQDWTTRASVLVSAGHHE